MVDFSMERARDAYEAASPSVRQVMKADARAALECRQAAMIALEGRVAQLAAALFAAAAFAASFAVDPAISARLALRLLAGGATLLFFVGSVFALLGLRARDIVFPGASPSWWGTPEFLAKKKGSGAAEVWSAGNWEAAIESYDRIARSRARMLNYGLGCGVAGGALLAFGAVPMIVLS